MSQRKEKNVLNDSSTIIHLDTDGEETAQAINFKSELSSQ